MKEVNENKRSRPMEENKMKEGKEGMKEMKEGKEGNY